MLFKKVLFNVPHLMPPSSLDFMSIFSFRDSSQLANEEVGILCKVSGSLKNTFSHFLRADVWKPLLIMILLGFSQQVILL